MLNDNESPFTLTLLEDDLSFLVVQFSGHEALNQPYRFEVEVIGLPPAMPFDQLLQQPLFLSLGHGQGFHGILHSVSREYRGAHRVGYTMVMVPYLQALDRNCRRRVFHDLSVPMIRASSWRNMICPLTAIAWSWRAGTTCGRSAFSTRRATWRCCNACARKKAFTITSNISVRGMCWCWPTTA